MLLSGTTCFLESMVCHPRPKHQVEVHKFSSQIDMDLMAYAEQWKKVDPRLLGKIVMDIATYAKIRLGLCTPVLWKIEKYPYWELSRCRRSGIRKRMAELGYGLQRGLLEGKSIRFWATAD